MLACNKESERHNLFCKKPTHKTNIFPLGMISPTCVVCGRVCVFRVERHIFCLSDGSCPSILYIVADLLFTSTSPGKAVCVCNLPFSSFLNLFLSAYIREPSTTATARSIHTCFVKIPCTAQA